ncbi:Zn-dependent alcohol dehydrogenase [Paeniglutamicibacter psychrophenolicus]|uniref:S-(Hydroxymethyl)glutathione dehydrogenase/alcohol dehydrogenase n=1 Tax=Paeniglutamicibacter psychrophenolicus TaxID=257454 RepID=A0ABS4WAY3_9MICC|nr:zinc-binding dehydrogenase [Paeniglutamicibacter psychrophenolicus]MBP2373348.1 S-(hydroxymethyl)glutathione dehydrogenase/alcohol dehydrogenase [Paeniglutamicibacter psychrophenolicus]
MQAVVVHEIGGGFHVEDIAIDDPIGQEVLVEVKASGLCRTDLSVASHRHEYPVPAVFGHELAGIVTKIGPEVTDFAVGDHVVGSLIQFCGRCANCLSERSFQCLDRDATLRTSDQPSRLTRDGVAVAQGFGLGAFAQQALVHSNQLVKIADEMPFPQAALLGCGGLTGTGAVLNTAKVKPGESVVIVGAGGVGLNGVNGAVIAGASPIIVIDVAEAKLEKAREFGATHTVNSAEEDPVAAVKAIAGGGADHVFDFVGIGKVQEQGVAMLGKGGGLYLIGVTSGQTMNIDGRALLQGQNSITGIHMGSGVLRRDVPAYVDLYLAGKLKLDDMISKEIGLGEVEAGYEMLKDPTVTRVVVTSF